MKPSIIDNDTRIYGLYLAQQVLDEKKETLLKERFQIEENVLDCDLKWLGDEYFQELCFSVFSGKKIEVTKEGVTVCE